MRAPSAYVRRDVAAGAPPRQCRLPGTSSNSHSGIVVCGRGGTRPSKSFENAGFDPGGPASTPAVSRKAAKMRMADKRVFTIDIGWVLRL